MRTNGNTDLRAFVAVAEQGSFSKAAEVLGLSPSSLSQVIRTFEERLGVRLLHRTTRSVSLTEAGERLLLRTRPALAELDAALMDVSHFRDRPAGIVRVRCLRIAFRTFVDPILAEFHETHPEIKLDILVDDAVTDLVAGGFDVGFTLGEVIEKDLVGIKLGGDMRQIAVATPDYIAKHGRPQTPRDLLSHKCLRWRWPGRTTPYNWEFFKDGAWFEVEVDGPLVLSEQTMAVDAALKGMGIAFWVEHELRPLIEAGKLVPLLEEWSGEFPGLYICYPQQRQMAPALRAFIDFVKNSAAKR
jgi:DNA-binding transcriptional LysR family regulator